MEEEQPLPKRRMIPDPKLNRGGRANPAGFAYLYLAREPETALAEMRPWVKESLTVALFEIKKDIRLVVCQAVDENWEERLFEESPPPEKVDQYIWNDIGRAFAQPVSQGDQESAYLPTQILAEAFKAEGFHGLAYRSGLARGTNVVLFNAGLAKLIRRYVYTLRRVRYDFEAVPNHAIYRKKNGVVEPLTELKSESP